MKSIDDLLERLFKAAAAAHHLEGAAPSPALERRALAAWRSSRAGRDLSGLLRWFRVGLGFASVLTVAIIALSLLDIAKEPGRELAMPNVLVNLALSP